jgi:hypothetical protein
MRPHLEIVSALIPLMGKPKIGQEAKEAMLVAISMRNPIVDQFLLHETKLFENIISELSKKFQASVAFMVSQTQQIGSPNASLAMSPGAQSGNKSGSLEAFQKILRFCAGIVAVCVQSSTLSETDIINNLQSSTAASVRSSILDVMCTLFADSFLKNCVRIALMENSEQHVLAAQNVLRMILAELFLSAPGKISLTGDNRSGDDATKTSLRRVNRLCTITAKFLCDDAELLQVFIARVGSVNRVVSMSTVQVLTAVMMTSSLSDCQNLILPNISTSEAAQSTEEQGSYTSESIEEKKSRRHEIFHSANSKFVSTEKESVNSAYIKSYVDRTLRLLSDQVSVRNCANTMSDVSHRGSILKLTLHKLSSFLSLRLEEQIAVSGLVEKCITVLCATAYRDQNELIGDIALKSLVSILDIVVGLESQVSGHLYDGGKIVDAAKKVHCMRLMLSSGDANSMDSRARRIIEKESQQVVRILECAVVVEELVREVRSALRAVEYLEVGLNIDQTTIPVPIDTNTDVGVTDDEQLSPTTPFLVDDDDDDEAVRELREFKVAITESERACGAQVIEDEFLAELAEMENNLTLLLA